MEKRIARLVLPHCYPVMLTGNFHSHWGDRPWTPDGVYGDDVHESLRGKPRYRGVQHDRAPKLWPWWLVSKVVMVRLNVHPP